MDKRGGSETGTPMPREMIIWYETVGGWWMISQWQVREFLVPTTSRACKRK